MKHVKAKVICIFNNGGKILVGKATDKIKKEIYYRPLGGSIEFGEHSVEALKREIIEETNNEIENIQYISLLENMFICDGEPGHEIILIYRAEFKNKKLYEMKELQECGAIEEGWESVCWKDIKDFINGDRLYPEGLNELLIQSKF